MIDAPALLARVHEVFDYDPETGSLRWKVRLSNRATIGAIAGSLHRPSGYHTVFLDGRAYKAHRLIWLYCKGEWPSDDIDHINGLRADNRIGNLRPATRSMNQENLRYARGDTASGVLGVSPTDRQLKPWRASIRIKGRSVHLGRFATKEEAESAYLAAKRKLHEGCTI